MTTVATPRVSHWSKKRKAKSLLLCSQRDADEVKAKQMESFVALSPVSYDDPGPPAFTNHEEHP